MTDYALSLLRCCAKLRQDEAMVLAQMSGWLLAMARPSLEEFKNMLIGSPLEQVVDTHVFADDPFVFDDVPNGMRTLQEHLTTFLGTDGQDVAVVGSGKIGFSLKPRNFGQRFSDKSDVDVVVVDEGLFDTVWSTLLDWNYPRRHRLPGPDWQWVKARITKELYWGWFTPDRIRFDGLSFPGALASLRDISTNWFNAFHSLARYPELSRHDFSGRLYRTWHHARIYHVNGLRRIRDDLASAGGS